MRVTACWMRSLAMVVVVIWAQAHGAQAVPSGGLSEFPLATPPPALPDDIVEGADGALWFTKHLAIGRIMSTGDVSNYPIDTQPHGVGLGPDGNIWFTLIDTGEVGFITPAGTVTRFSVGKDAKPDQIVTGPDGNLWFTDFSNDRIVAMSPVGVEVRTMPVTPGSRPHGITVGPDGNLWFTETFLGADPPQPGRIGMTTPTGLVTEFEAFDLPLVSWDIATGADGALWFTECSIQCSPFPGTIQERIGRMSVTGITTHYSVGLSAGSHPFGITAGPDGALWFAEWGGNRIGRIDLAGSITEFLLPSAASSPVGIASGPGDSVWFTEYRGNRIGRIDVVVTTH